MNEYQHDLQPDKEFIRFEFNDVSRFTGVAFICGFGLYRVLREAGVLSR